MGIDPEIFPAVGGVVIAWSELESRTRLALLFLCGNGIGNALHAQSGILIEEMSIEAQWNAIEKLLGVPPAHDREARREFVEWRKKATKLKSSRNDVVHATWAGGSDDQPPAAMAIDFGSRRTKGTLRPDVIPGAPDSVFQLARDIHDHAQILMKWSLRQLLRLQPDVAVAPTSS